MLELIARIEEYGFTCEAGDLDNCKEWEKLKRWATDVEEERFRKGKTTL